MLTLFLVVFWLMLLEAWHATANERTQRALGGVEPDGDVYAAMLVAYPGAFVMMLVEGLARSAPGTGRVWILGVMLFVAAKALKWWAIASLGRCWTFRVIVVPGMRRVRTGPYRVLRHPNYVAVVGELVGVALMTSAWVSGPLAVVGFGALIGRRVAVENRALDVILRRT